MLTEPTFRYGIKAIIHLALFALASALCLAIAGFAVLWNYLHYREPI